MEKQRSSHRKTDSPARSRPLVFGEVLFDEFEDGSAILGGAPFNVAWHLQGFGLKPLFVSKIGHDQRGQKILDTMQQWKMDTSGVQLDDTHPTGKVTIKLKQGQHTFNILPDQAYDNIDNSALSHIDASTPSTLLYHGSLALRNKVSQQTFDDLRTKSSSPVFVDINLRNPWWTNEIIQSSLNNATWAKLNDIELAEVAKTEPANKAEQKEIAMQVRESFGLELLIITLGSEGAWFISKDEFIEGAPVPAKNIVDTVGAGDAFSAVTIYGLLHKWPLEIISKRAMTFASSVCEMRGATTTNKHLYKENLSLWEK